MLNVALSKSICRSSSNAQASALKSLPLMLHSEVKQLNAKVCFTPLTLQCSLFFFYIFIYTGVIAPGFHISICPRWLCKIPLPRLSLLLLSKEKESSPEDARFVTDMALPLSQLSSDSGGIRLYEHSSQCFYM